jgi:flagellar FliL protein
MAEQDEVEEKKKSPIIKIVLLVVGFLLVIAVSVGATLFLTGFFQPKEEKQVEEKLKEVEKKAKSEAEAKKDASPEKVKKETPELTRFQNTYVEWERELLANVTNSRKVIQVQVAFMTRYDDRVIKNIKKHELALRASALDVLRKVTEPEITQDNFRKALAEKIRVELNAVLEKYEDFGGIEELYFTTLVVQ